jgi:hypothetical protein
MCVAVTPLDVTDTSTEYVVDPTREPVEAHWPVVGDVAPAMAVPAALVTFTVVMDPAVSEMVTRVFRGTLVAPAGGLILSAASSWACVDRTAADSRAWAAAAA